MNKRISVISIICGVIISIFMSAQVSAVIADYAETVAKQQSEAEIIVMGKVISTNYAPKDENNYDQTVNYELKVETIVSNGDQGKQITIGTIIQMSHNCDMASEMHIPVTKSECVKSAPKVGDEKTVYMNYIGPIMCDVAPCPQYSQAVIYEDDIIDFGSKYPTTNNYTAVYVAAITLLAIATGAIIFVNLKKKNAKTDKLVKK